MRADRHEALLDFLLEAVADGALRRFPRTSSRACAGSSGARRSAIGSGVRRSCWSPRWPPMTRRRSCRSGAHTRRLGQDDPLGGDRTGARCPTANGLGGLWRSAISSAIANSAAGALRRGLQAARVRAVMKVFLPTGRAAGASFVFDTTGSRFTETDRLTLERLVPHLGQLRRNALARRTYPALIDATAAARMRLLRLAPRERVVLARAAAGETNTVIARRCSSAPGPSASTLNTSTTSSKSAPEQKRPRSTPKGGWSYRARVWTPGNAQTLAEPASGRVD